MSFNVRYCYQAKKLIKKFLFVIIVVLVSAIMLMPFGWILGTSMRKASESFALYLEQLVYFNSVDFFYDYNSKHGGLRLFAYRI